MVSTSVVVIAVRQGNPKGVKDWADLTKPGLNILTPDPNTSGGAQWNINAIYGAALRGYTGVPKEDPAAAQNFLRDVFRNVSIRDKGARESITNYEKGVGEVAITDENDVLVGRQGGQTYDYVVPRSTILIENPVALVDKHGVREAAEAFIKFLSDKEAQRAYAKYGLRPVDMEVAREVQSQYPAVEDLWKIDFLGGWAKVGKDIYGPQGVYTKVYEELHSGNEYRLGTKWVRRRNPAGGGAAPAVGPLGRARGGHHLPPADDTWRPTRPPRCSRPFPSSCWSAWRCSGSEATARRVRRFKQESIINTGRLICSLTTVRADSTHCLELYAGRAAPDASSPGSASSSW